MTKTYRPTFRYTRTVLFACACLALLAAIFHWRAVFVPAAHAQGAAVPPSTLPVGDFNGDGKLDVAMARTGRCEETCPDSNVAIFLNTTGAASPQPVPTPTPRPSPTPTPTPTSYSSTSRPSPPTRW